MKPLSAATLRRLLVAEFPPDTPRWCKATDEVRDMCRAARLLAGVSEEEAVNFRQIDNPAQWNRQGIDGTIRFYEMLSEVQQVQFCGRFEGWLAEWMARNP